MSRRRRTLTLHRPDPVSLFFGLAFTLAGVVGLVGSRLPALADAPTLLGVLALMGGLVVIASVLSARGADPVPTPQVIEPSPVPLLTPEEVREEDLGWLGRTGGLTDAEREVLAALEGQEPPQT